MVGKFKDITLCGSTRFKDAFMGAQKRLTPYTDSDGNVYESYEAYCNSPDLDDYTIMLKLHAGTRTPQNERERILLQEMKEIEARGEMIDFSENIW